MSCEWEIYFVPVHTSVSTVSVSAFFIVSVSVCQSVCNVYQCGFVYVSKYKYKCALCQCTSVCVCVSGPMCECLLQFLSVSVSVSVYTCGCLCKCKRISPCVSEGVCVSLFMSKKYL